MNRLFPLAALTLAMIAAAHAEDNWQRVKGCAAQAEKWEKKNPPYPGYTGGYEQQYSPKYDRCYVRWTVIRAHTAGNVAVYLYDAFEDHSLAWASADVAGVHPGMQGWIEGRFTDYETADRFIEEHMRN